eukprot:m.337108 g.337108  ORF g.337108 m.337108 type:complete len:139 (-) comp16079_c2_seq2:190-606(-)
MLLRFYLFDRSGKCLYSQSWNDGLAKESTVEVEKLVFGLLHSIKGFVAKLTPDATKGTFRHLKTQTYKLHCLNTLTGLRFVLMTDPNTGDISQDLDWIYSDVYVDTVVKNPLAVHGEPISNPAFAAKLDAFVHSRKYF